MIKYTHACVRIEDGDRVLVIDPGNFSEPVAIDGADDILVTHEHADHIDVENIKKARETNPRLTVYTHEALATRLTDLGDGVRTVAVGEDITVAGFSVRAVGGNHAEIYDGLPGCPNIGFIVNGNVYHPGDSFFVPAENVETLLVPASAPWMKLAEALDFSRAVKPARAFPIHDAMLSEIGITNFSRWMEMKGETDYKRLNPSDEVSL